MRYVSRALLAVLALGVILLAGGWTYQRIAEHRDNRRYPPPGELHSVNGHLMHIHCREAAARR